MASSLHCGLYPNWGGGLLLKLALRDGPPRVLAFQSECVFYLQENLKRSVVDGNFSDPRGVHGHSAYGKVLELQPDLTPDDFRSADASSTVNGWNWCVLQDGVAVEVQLSESDSETYLFTPEVLFLLLDYVDRFIERGDLIDLREFRRLAVHEMEDEILGSNGYRLMQEYERFDYSRRLLDRNYEELIRHLQQFDGHITNPDFVLWVRRHSINIFMEETLRLLHNFVAACASLIDHSRVFFGRLEKELRPLPRYQEEIDRRFVQDPLSQFVVGLRQFAQHYRLPNISTEREFGSDGIRGRVLLLKEDLLAFASWNAPAKQFIHEQGKKINLLEVLRAYHHKVTVFHRWLRREWSHTFRRELQATELKRQALLAKQGEGLVSELRRSLSETRPKSAPQVVDLLSRFLSAEELHMLETSPPDVRRALEFAENRFPLPKDLKADLLRLGGLEEDGVATTGGT